MKAALRRFFAQPGARWGTAFLALAAAVALAAPVIAPYRPSAQLDIIALQNRPPSWTHPFGTDFFSRDLLSRLIFGARVSLGVGFLAALVAAAVGTAVGAAAGYFRRATDTILMRLVDIGLAVPRIFLVLVVIAVGNRIGVLPLALLLGLTGWFATSRLVRADVLALRDYPFVEAARTLGASPWRVIGRHVVPNVLATVIVSTALGVANMMLLEAGLSFLGAGVQAPTPSWGNMIAEGRDQLLQAPWISVFPGLAITATVMALHAVVDALRAVLDPRENPAAS